MNRLPSRPLIPAALAVLALGLAVIANLGPGRSPAASVRRADPRETLPSSSRNVRPGVPYVGDQACSACHSRQARSYVQHPMGRSLAPVAASRTEVATGSFTADGRRYRVERRGGRLIHGEDALDAAGRVIERTESPVDFVVGSGRRGLSFLIDRGGRLFQSPITWYTQSRKWGLSPGYREKNLHFSRPITAECLFCHSNRAVEIEQTLNAFAPPIFQGHAIGCERCHGPGGLHVSLHERAGTYTTPDDTIVNPRHLAAPLREAVCQQCHLAGLYRVLPSGRGPFDFRPGLPLAPFLSVFDRPLRAGETARFTGHVEQMNASRCFQGSKGTFGCITCHDPHEVPAPAKRVAYFRERCVACHGNRGCRLMPEVRMERSKEDSCIQCHMPARSTEIAHTSVTDHRILRDPAAEKAPAAAQDAFAIAHFHKGAPDASEAGAARDLSVGVMDFIERYPRPVQQTLATSLLPVLESARSAAPGDVEAWNAEAVALWTLGRKREAAGAFDRALALAPRREVALHGAASLAMEMGELPRAGELWGRAVEVNPHRQDLQHGRAEQLAGSGRAEAALVACRAALALDSPTEDLLKLAIRCHMQLGDSGAARAELARAVALFPQSEAALRRWFEETARSRR